MFLQESSGDTITTVMDKLDQPIEGIGVNGADISVAYESGVIRLGTQREVPITGEAISVLSDWTGVPSAFINRVDPELQEHILNYLLRQNPVPAVARVANDGLRGVRKTSEKFIEPRRIVEVASHVLTPQAPVTFWSHQEDEFWLDAVVPDGATFGIGGDPNAVVLDAKGERRVGDLTKGGLRFGMKGGKQNLAPWVQEFSYRLICTNGMEVMDKGLKVSARGDSVDSVMAELERQAQVAFGRVERTISAFYDLRNERESNPERTMLRLAQEAGLPERAMLELVEQVPSVVDDEGEATMFDLVNLVTNRANDPAVNHSMRRRLQRFGGTVVSTHSDRCGRCRSKLSH